MNFFKTVKLSFGWPVLSNWLYKPYDWSLKETYSGNITFDGSKQEEKSWTILEQACSKTLILFIPTFVHFVEYLPLLLEKSDSKNWWQINCLWKNFYYCSILIYLNKQTPTKTRVLVSFVGPSETEKHNLFKLVENLNLSKKGWRFSLFPSSYPFLFNEFLMLRKKLKLSSLLMV